MKNKINEKLPLVFESYTKNGMGWSLSTMSVIFDNFKYLKIFFFKIKLLIRIFY